jgi:subtilase family serine protease
MPRLLLNFSDLRLVRLIRRNLGIVLSSGTILLSPGWLQAQSGQTIELSPVVSQYPLISPADPATEITVALSLPLSDPQGAQDYVRNISNPTNPLYRKYLTPQEFATRFGGNAADYAALKEWANANGLQISEEYTARTLLSVRGTVGQFQTLFKTQLSNYRSPDGQEFISASVKPVVPEEIAAKVKGVIGLTSSIQYAPLAKVHKVFGENIDATPVEGGGTGPGGAFFAEDLRTAYSIPSFGKARPQTVAVFEQGGFTASDVTTYLKANKLANPGVSVIKVNGYNGKVNNNNVELEAVLDIDMMIGINPNLSQVLVYEDGDSNFSVALSNAIAKVADQDRVSVLSISYGLDEVQQGAGAIEAEDNLLVQLVSEGITALASAGDQGAYGRTGGNTYPASLNVGDPGSQRYILCVGGTSLYVDSTENYQSETSWEELQNGEGATGGGVSSYWALPFYQNASVVTQNGGSSTARNVPDVAAVGDPATGVAVYSKVNGGWIQIGGTSASAPIWGGYMSVLNAASQDLTNSVIGFPNWMIYEMNGGDASSALYDVFSGSNGYAPIYGTPGYNAGYGYDNCTGCGSMLGALSAYTFLLVEGPYRVPDQKGTNPPGEITDLTAKPTADSVTLTWKESKGATGYIVLITYPRANSSYVGAQAFLTKSPKQRITKLAGGTQYSAWVGALNKKGAASASVIFTTE